MSRPPSPPGLAAARPRRPAPGGDAPSVAAPARPPAPLTLSAANVTLRQLEVLVAVAECGRFGAAAARLHMTQSAVSQAVQGLERVLEAPLLVRGRGRVLPTALGERVLGHARRALTEVRAIAAVAAEHYGTDAGTVRVASIRSVARQLLAPALPAFAVRFPRVAVAVLEGTDREVHAWLAEGLVDVALVAPLLAAPPAAEVVTLADDPWYALLPSEHRDARRRAAALGDLAREPYVMADGGCEPAVRALFASAGATPDVRQRALGTDTLMAMVAAGLGWTLVPGFAAAAGLPTGVAAVPLAPSAARTVAAVLPAGARTPAAARALVAALARDGGPRTS